jgi:hypothetical protein
LVKNKRSAQKRGKSNVINPIDSDEILRKDFPKITDSELVRLKTDESYKEGFLLAINLVFSELKSMVEKK